MARLRNGFVAAHFRQIALADNSRIADPIHAAIEMKNSSALGISAHPRASQKLFDQLRCIAKLKAGEIT
jgi:hypothetical protein